MNYSIPVPVDAFNNAVEDFKLIAWKQTIDHTIRDFVLGDLYFGRRKRSLSDAFVKAGFAKKPKDDNEFISRFEELEVHDLQQFNDHQRSGGIFRQEYGIPSHCKLIIKHVAELDDEPETGVNISLDTDEKVEDWLGRCNNEEQVLNESFVSEISENGENLEQTFSDIGNISSISQQLRDRRYENVYF